MLKPADIESIHDGALRILSRAGVAFQDPETVALCAAHGLPVEGDRVYPQERHVQAALQEAPSRFTMAGRTAHRDLTFGGDSLVVATAATAPYVLEGTHMRPATLADLEACVKVMHSSENVDMLGVPVDAQDVPLDRRYRTALYACLTLSDKLIEYPMSSQENLRVVSDISEIVHGPAWFERPRVLCVLNSTSPLTFEPEVCLATRELARLGQVVCITPCVVGGATGPATMAGILTLQHAEVLAGLVLTQLVRPGCPFIYGGTSSIASMVTGDLLVGVPQYWALMTSTVDIARRFGLPCRAGGALTDSHVLDMQAGIESAMGLATVVLAGVNFILHGTGIVSSFNAVSFEKFIIDDELVAMIRARNRPIVVDEETMAVDVIAEVGPGGNFLLRDHTYRHCRDYERPSFFNRRKYDVWLSRGGWDLAEAARTRFHAIEEAHASPALDADVLARLEQYCLQ